MGRVRGHQGKCKRFQIALVGLTPVMVSLTYASGSLQTGLQSRLDKQQILSTPIVMHVSARLFPRLTCTFQKLVAHHAWFGQKVQLVP
jgi:hypothetical protein